MSARANVRPIARVIAVDRSGARDAAGVWLAEVVDGAVTRLEPPGSRARAVSCSADAAREAAAAGARVSPKSVFQVFGPGQVGTMSIRGMPLLRDARAAGLAVWPFDEPAPEQSVVVEIYPRAYYGDAVVKGDPEHRRAYLERYQAATTEAQRAVAVGSDHAFDALTAALAMWKDRAGLAALPPVASADVRLEGWIWGPPPPAASRRPCATERASLPRMADVPPPAPTPLLAASFRGDLPVAELQRYGRELIDWIAGYLADPEQYPVLARVRPGEVAAALPPAPPAAGESLADILADAERVLVPGITHWNHPGFFAYFANSSAIPGILGELLAAALNVNAMLWAAAPAATELEQVALDWLRQLLGMGEGWFGLIHDTASLSTMIALAAAREADPALAVRERGMAGRADLPALRVYCSEQAHSSVDKAAIALGIGHANVVKVPVDEAFRMRPDALAAAMDADAAAGMRPIAVVATTGTTGTTSIDPVRAIAAVCQPRGAWLHVDGAYGAPAAIVPELRAVLDGVELADSLVVNPHKWLFTPMDCSVLYTRRPEVLRRAFSLVPEYLVTRPAGDSAARVDLMDYGVQLGRRFRALKLWMVLRAFGAEGLAERIRYHVQLARLFAEWVEAEPGWEVAAPHPLSLICFRAAPAGLGDAECDALNARVLAAVNAGGEAFLSHTKLGGRYVLRLAVGNIRTEERHVARAWTLLREAAARESAAHGAPHESARRGAAAPRLAAAA